MSVVQKICHFIFLFFCSYDEQKNVNDADVNSALGRPDLDKRFQGVDYFQASGPGNQDFAGRSCGQLL